MVDDFDTAENRRQLVDLLIDAGVGGLASHPGLDGFVSGTGDISLGGLVIDSLALMEIGIEIEDVFEASLSPHALSNLGTLGELWSMVRKERGAPG